MLHQERTPCRALSWFVIPAEPLAGPVGARRGLPHPRTRAAGGSPLQRIRQVQLGRLWLGFRTSAVGAAGLLTRRKTLPGRIVYPLRPDTGSTLYSLRVVTVNIPCQNHAQSTCFEPSLIWHLERKAWHLICQPHYSFVSDPSQQPSPEELDSLPKRHPSTQESCLWGMAAFGSELATQFSVRYERPSEHPKLCGGRMLSEEGSFFSRRWCLFGGN